MILAGGLTSIIADSVAKIPREIAKQHVIEKLETHSIDDENLAEALTEHLFSETSEPFEYDDPKYDDLSITFSDEDTKAMMAEIQDFSDNKLPEVVQKTLDAVSRDFLDELKADWPEQKTYQEEIDKLRRSKAKKNVIKRDALAVLHMRSCQVAQEILVLLKNGLADGAFARWRTIYEISVVMSLIDKFGDGLAEKYYEHAAVKAKEEFENDVRFYGSAKDAGYSKKEAKQIKDDYAAALSEHGQPFGTAYGWAAHHLENKRPTFQDLEVAAGRTRLPPSFKSSSFKVHASIVGTLSNLGHLDDMRIPLSGASNAGLAIPASHAAHALCHNTAILYGTSYKPEDQMQLKALLHLRDEVEREGEKAAKKLRQDELALQIVEIDTDL